LRVIRLLSLVCLLALPAAAHAQTRRRTTTTRRPAPTTRSKPSPVSVTTLNEARLKVADRLKVLTRFLYLYARASRDLEATEAQARQAGAQSPTLERSRAELRANLQNVSAGLDDLERYFKLTPGADRYYQSLAGVAATSARAEQSVAAGQYDQAGRALLDVVNRLTDVLLEME
jgi:hypothetical protein